LRSDNQTDKEDNQETSRTGFILDCLDHCTKNQQTVYSIITKTQLAFCNHCKVRVFMGEERERERERERDYEIKKKEKVVKYSIKITRHLWAENL
jgi:hypothetical protein